MSNQNQKPTLQGQRIKTRKRDEKEKYDPVAFRDAILQGINEAGTDLEQVSKFLDFPPAKLNYRRYAETLFDVLFAGGILAPGGSVLEDADSSKVSRTETCVFGAKDDFDSLKAHYEVFFKLIRRHKYLERSFEEELKKLILFLKGFKEAERRKLATVTGICLANGLGNPACLMSLFEDHLVKEGLSLTFITQFFKVWLQEKDMRSMAPVLRKFQAEDKLMNLLPINKRTQENFENHFKGAGLEPIVEYQRIKASGEVKRELQKALGEMIKDDEPVKEMVIMVREQMKKNGMPEHEVIVMVWNTLMNGIEWSKKEELVAEQALKHLRSYAVLLGALTDSARSELALMLKVQEYCYENQNFMKSFQKIIVLLYKAEVVREEVINKWYKDGHSAKGKSVFLDQLKPFVEWLENAEEESEEDEDD